jgi:hypothetical protein
MVREEMHPTLVEATIKTPTTNGETLNAFTSYLFAGAQLGDPGSTSYKLPLASASRAGDPVHIQIAHAGGGGVDAEYFELLTQGTDLMLGMVGNDLVGTARFQGARSFTAILIGDLGFGFAIWALVPYGQRIESLAPQFYTGTVATTAPLDAYTATGTPGGYDEEFTANANGALVVDNESPQVGDTVFVKDEPDASKNMLAQVIATGDGSNPWVLRRFAAATTGELSSAPENILFVRLGQQNAGTFWWQFGSPFGFARLLGVRGADGTGGGAGSVGQPASARGGRGGDGDAGGDGGAGESGSVTGGDGGTTDGGTGGAGAAGSVRGGAGGEDLGAGTGGAGGEAVLWAGPGGPSATGTGGAGARATVSGGAGQGGSDHGVIEIGVEADAEHATKDIASGNATDKPKWTHSGGFRTPTFDLGSQASDVEPDLRDSDCFEVVLTGNATLTPIAASLAAGVADGQRGFIHVTQDGTGGRTLAEGAGTAMPGGAITLSAGAGQTDTLAYVVKGSTMRVWVAELNF